MFGPGDIGDQLQLHGGGLMSYDKALDDRSDALINNDTALAAQKTLEAAHYRYSLDTIAFKLALFAMLDTATYDPDTLRHRLGLMDNYGAEMMLAADYLASGEDSMAFAVLSNAPSKLDLTDAQTEDLLNTDTLFTILAGKPLESLGVSDLENIEKIAYKQGEFAPGLAKNILEKYGWHFPPETCLHQSTDPDGLIGNPNGGNTISHHEVLEVFPNPASDRVTFKLLKQLEKEETVILQVRSTTGQIMLTHQFFAYGDSSFDWQTTLFPSGIYFYQIRSMYEKPSTGKIILQN
jgi:hypothetical protein